MNNLKKIPVTILTGFLGAGKTTLIRSLILNNKSKRLAVIINEFGDLGVDGEIIKQCADDSCPAENILELANGCICCTVADDFVPTMKLLLEGTYLPDHILIETSGLALPKPLLKAFEWPEIRSRLTVDSVLAVVDAEAVNNGTFAPEASAELMKKQNETFVEHETPLSEVFEDQINCADVILLTKPDLIGDLGSVKDIIQKELQKTLPILEVENGKIDARLILGLNSEAESDLDSRKSHHDDFDDHEHDDFETFNVSLNPISDVKRLKEVLQKLINENDILRVKGFLTVVGKPLKLLVQAVGKRLSVNFIDTDLNITDNSNLVVIAERGKLDIKLFTRLLINHKNK
jgi:cobalamin biosynthesis protein CobW